MLNQSRKKGRAAIVLLSDGAANEGENPITVATQAARDKVSIDTVALGTPNGTLANPDPLGPPVPVPPDPQLMQQIALRLARIVQRPGCRRAQLDLQGARNELGSVTRKRDITAVFAIGGLAFLLLGAATSTRWAGRLP